MIVTPVRTGVSAAVRPHDHASRVTEGSETTARPTRVFVADGHATYRDGMARLLGDHPAVDLVGEAADGTAALADILRLQPDVALLEVGMRGLTGLEVCRRLRTDAPRTRVVLITGSPDRDVSAAAADAGAIALLAKETPPGALVADLVAAGQGRVARAVE